MTSPAPERPTKVETVTVNVPLPVELHRQLRIRAIEQGLSMKQAVTAAVEAWAAEAGSSGRAA